MVLAGPGFKAYLTIGITKPRSRQVVDVELELKTFSKEVPETLRIMADEYERTSVLVLPETSPKGEIENNV